MQAKSNIGPDDGGFEYAFTQVELEKLRGVWASRVDWGAPIKGCARDILAEAEQPKEGRAPHAEAAEFLKTLLAAGPLPAQEVLNAARGAGIARATLKRAKAKIGVVSRRDGFGPDGSWEWALRSTAPSIEAQCGHKDSVTTMSPFVESGSLCAAGADCEDDVEVEF